MRRRLLVRPERKRRGQVAQVLPARDEVTDSLEMLDRPPAGQRGEDGHWAAAVGDLYGLSSLNTSEQLARPLAELANAHTDHVLVVAHHWWFARSSLTHPGVFNATEPADVESGEPVTITINGRAVAVLRPVREPGHALDASALPDDLGVSIITIGELRAGVLGAVDVDTRDRRLATFSAAQALDPIPIDEPVAHAWARLRVLLRGFGRRMPVDVARKYHQERSLKPRATFPLLTRA